MIKKSYLSFNRFIIVAFSVTFVVFFIDLGVNGFSNKLVTQVVPSVSGALPAPTDLKATKVSSSRIKLEWQYVGSDNSGFKIERTSDNTCSSGFTVVENITAKSTRYRNNDIQSNTYGYCYRIRAYVGSGSNIAYSPYSNLASDVYTFTATITPNPITMARPSNSSVGISINPIANSGSAFSASQVYVSSVVGLPSGVSADTVINNRLIYCVPSPGCVINMGLYVATSTAPGSYNVTVNTKNNDSSVSRSSTFVLIVLVPTPTPTTALPPILKIAKSTRNIQPSSSSFSLSPNNEVFAIASSVDTIWFEVSGARPNAPIDFAYNNGNPNQIGIHTYTFNDYAYTDSFGYKIIGPFPSASGVPADWPIRPNYENWVRVDDGPWSNTVRYEIKSLTSVCDSEISTSGGLWTRRWGTWLNATVEPGAHPICNGSSISNGKSALITTSSTNNGVAMEWYKNTPYPNLRTAEVSFMIPTSSFSGWNHIALFPAYRRPTSGVPITVDGLGRIGADIFHDSGNTGRIVIQFQKYTDNLDANGNPAGCDGTTNNVYNWSPISAGFMANHWYRLSAKIIQRSDMGLDISGTLKDLEQPNTPIIAQTSYSAPATCTPAWYNSQENRWMFGVLDIDPTRTIDTYVDDFIGYPSL